jgi:hypothetical protein
VDPEYRCLRMEAGRSNGAVSHSPNSPTRWTNTLRRIWWTRGGAKALSQGRCCRGPAPTPPIGSDPAHMRDPTIACALACGREADKTLQYFPSPIQFVGASCLARLEHLFRGVCCFTSVLGSPLESLVQRQGWALRPLRHVSQGISRGRYGILGATVAFRRFASEQ